MTAELRPITDTPALEGFADPIASFDVRWLD